MRTKPVCDPRSIFFDSIAAEWDARQDRPDLARDLDACLAQFGLKENEVVLDVGCGTGNLTVALLRRLGPAGRVMAIDISDQMLARAKGKVSDARVTWRHASADRLPAADEEIDRVLCFSVWPHLENPAAAVTEFYRVLRPGGFLHIWHLISRDKVNRIHQEADPAVQHDRLAPVGETASLLKKNRFSMIAMADDETRYSITGRKEELSS
ncbi:MAG: class I SAM-dependent methyltransferase [Verrucomicrobia bacterium]|nr:class I SAM-dependent methyltransferase [Verrucomicrobiota bacterium]MCG2678472.1 class I SAM-dependent methyltransferase [Kiritimatiellia bacterium]MBU4248075.1 class I SAM-dependent methyltransferase [Verrucomicrobiota bacterium]MBU4290231.1 class I SAM-dependent methyltransferase [Verrucomicrobiota bacterium]MBU4430212.1 class I SAM-dependent methyltransferase [Verrucomicrobiota bacterium]